MWTNILSNKYLYYGLAGVLLMILIYLAFFKDKTVSPPESKPLPNTQSWGSTLNEVDALKIRNYAINLHGDMKGLNGFGWNEELYTNLLEENNIVLTAVYNDFNELYAHEEKGTFTAWLKDEGGFEDMFTPYFEDLVNRLQSLNLQ